MKKLILAIAAAMLAGSASEADEYHFPVDLKFDRERIYTPGHL